MPAATGGALTRADIETWDTNHLDAAAAHWRSTAAHWEGHFETIHNGMLRPGGTTWEGTAADAAAERSWGDLVKVRGAGDALYAAAGHATTGAGEIAWAKRQVLDAITEAEESGFTVGQDFSVTDKSWSLLRSTATRQQEAQSFATEISTRVQALTAIDKQVATQITGALAPVRQVRFDEAPKDKIIQPLDFKEAPPPSTPYPINDVIAEATDLDGNHIVMRRGYYDAVTKTGFGWDKAYWRHGVINPNVFKDLISHSRPVRNDGGTLVYEVPINRAHCTSGMFGLTSCEDTGESLTMKIVVNTNPSPDVPGGGQKGLITMYPLAGGSGVVEIQRGWTWTPPWVNNYVPIN